MNPNGQSFSLLHSHTNAEIRLAYLLAERRFAEPAIARSLRDSDPRLVLEAARAINDVPIPEALPALAALIAPRRSPGDEDPTSPSAASQSLLPPAPAAAWPKNLNFTHEEWRTWVLRRAVNANFRLGDATNAVALAQFAARAEAPTSVRVEALEDLAEWAQPSRRDKLVGLIRPLPPREPAPARDALAAVWDGLTRSTDTNVVLAALAAGNALNLPDWDTKLAAVAAHPNPAVGAEAVRLAGASRPATVAELVARLASDSLAERRQALARLAESPDAAATAAITAWMDKLVAGTVPPELQADVLDAAFNVGQASRLSGSDLTVGHASQAPAPNPRLTANDTQSSGRAGETPALRSILAVWTNSLPKDDVLAPYRVALAGGNAANGRRLFAERADWGCQRCHQLGGEGGEVGPELTGISRTKGREYVLRAILNPNAEIAAGFENVIVTRRDGTSVVGVLKAESAAGLVLESPEDGRVTVKLDDIAARDRGLSAMPEGMAELMTKRELRDLIEALAQ